MEQNFFPKIDMTFSPGWWFVHYGMAYPRAFWHDPVAFTQRDQEQRRLLYERFGDVGLGEADPQPRPFAGGEFGHRFMAALWGCQVIYPLDGAPCEVSLPDARERMVDLRVPDIDSSPVVQLALGNAGVMKERYGRCDSAINYGGPLNNAVSVFGGEFLTACATQPELAQQVLERMGQAVLAVHDQVSCRIREVEVAEARAGGWGIGNCPVCMLSPRMYREVVLPVDLWFRRQFAGDFNLHHCGVFDAYATVYQPLAPTDLDLGPGSDLRIARAAFPRARISTYIKVETLANMNREEIDALVGKMVREAGDPARFSWIRVAEAGPEVSDQAVRDLMTVAERVRE
jgi:hypothetical protein